MPVADSALGVEEYEILRLGLGEDTTPEGTEKSKINMVSIQSWRMDNGN